MNLSRLLLLHALVTLGAGVVLILSPARIPATVGIALPPDARLLAYLLGAAELALGALSYLARRIQDAGALRVVVRTFIGFHLATAAVEVLAFSQGLTARIWGNVALRLLISLLFYFYGLRRSPAGTRPIT
ncbi:hypothetical protein SAMN02745146_0114 [Hymenobacter daecheongensis DSM 21074]|uniref:DoxX-like family protein n=1 Tax=Hymenobacter daecheongensis DSM 21074 TaxID=1121955 RepID=A0A1M6LZE8_9BACT|nr:hypothetical protein [Hymenobacter daecheongensis]SHJ76596.1 hypothetical protein SAMN02745146_0114 [Hymenobacter daecheongensis DSM 21074]